MSIDGDWAFVAVWVMASIWIFRLARRPIKDSQLTQWSLRFDVVVDAASKDFVAERLRRARVIRWTSLGVGLNVSMLPLYLSAINSPKAAGFSNPAGSTMPWVAAAVGAVLAEIWVVQRPTGPRVADVYRRRWRDYADQRWVIGIAVCLPVAIAAAGLASANDEFRWRWSWVGPIAVVLAFVAATVGVWRVVDRPALAAGGQGRLLDDALRADGAHHVLGASVALAAIATIQTLNIAIADGWLSLVLALGHYFVLGRWHNLATNDCWSVQRARLTRA